MDFESLLMLYRTVLSLRLRRAGVSDSDIALAMSSPERLKWLGKPVPGRMAGHPLNLLVFGATRELGAIAASNPKGIVDVVTLKDKPLTDEKAAALHCGNGKPGLPNRATCHGIGVSYWTVLDRHGKSGSLKNEKMAINSVL